MRDGKQEVGDVIHRPSGEARIVVKIWSGKDIVIPYPSSSRIGYGLEERSALFAVTRTTVKER